MRSFKSKVDAWFVILALGLPVGVVAAIMATLNSADIQQPLVVIGSLVLVTALPLWLMLSTRYVVDDRRLLVRSGPFRWVVQLHEIRSVTPSRSLISSPALSLRRLRIDYARGQSLLVSPLDAEGFITALGVKGNVA